jgi:hypothetical protein
MSPPNEDARPEPGARKFLSQPSKPQAPTGCNKDFEDRRNASACFPNRDKSEDWHCDYQGVLVAENLTDGARVWVNIHQRTDRKGRPYLSVVLKPWRSETK